MARLSHRPVRRGRRDPKIEASARKYQSICTWHNRLRYRGSLVHTARTLLHPREMIDAGFVWKRPYSPTKMLYTAAIAQVRAVVPPPFSRPGQPALRTPHPRVATPLISRLSHHNPQISARTCERKTLDQGLATMYQVFCTQHVYLAVRVIGLRSVMRAT